MSQNEFIVHFMLIFIIGLMLANFIKMIFRR